MREALTLTLLELRGLYGINRYLHTRDKKEKNRCRLLGAAWFLVAAAAAFYVGGLVYGLCLLDMADIVPAYLVFLAAALVFVFGLFKAGHTVFGQRGYDMLCAMPIRPRAIVLSRFAALYLEDMVLSALVMVPGGVMYAIMARPGGVFYPAALLGTLLLPAIPLVAATLVGTAIAALAAPVRHKSLVETVLMVLLVTGILAGSFGLGGFAQDLTPEMLTDLAGKVGAVFAAVYPPALWLGEAMAGVFPAGLALFAALSVGGMALCLAVTVRCFPGIMGRMGRLSAGHDYRLTALRRRSMLCALYMREARRYFSSSIYVTNTIMGPVLGCMMCAALAVVGWDTVQSALPLDVRGGVPFVMASVFCMMTTTACSISMEGGQFWAVRSLPIPAKTLWDSKLLLQLSLYAPFYAVAEVCLAAALRPSGAELVKLILIPALLMVFSAVLGISVDLKFHRFDWEKETQVVKQGASAFLGGFAGMLLSLLLGGIALALPSPVTDLIICMALAAATAVLYRKNGAVRPERL